ncbi:uncharacterized protein LOC132948760 [Metopolophium dirhodum]|uniref:uncharacterized protein LOC132948760 n=1 Tax=Metopolophium dirhodum TaxID=44670 RepID=UPI002990152A|nr:uncharacterized protein LOC132948760 [Metopolophium dirhodum]
MHLFLALGLLIVCGMVDATFYSPRSQTFNQLMERRQRSIPIPYSYGYHYNPIEPSINVLDSLSEGLDSRINTFKPIYQNLKMSTHDVNSVPRTQYQPKNSLYDSEYISEQDIPNLFPEEDSYDYKYLGSPLNKYLTQPSTQESGIAINLVAIKKTSVFDYGFPTYKSPYSSVSVWNFGSKIPNTVFGDPQSVESDLDTFRVSSPTVKTVKLSPETSEQESIITTTKNDELNYKTTQETLTEAELYPTTSEENLTKDESSFITTEETLTEDKLNSITTEELQTEDESSFIATEEILTEDKSNSITTEGTQTEDESNSIEFNSIKTEDKSNSITTEENQKKDDESMSTTSQETTTDFNLNYAFDTNRYSSSHDSVMLKLRDLLKKIEDLKNKSQFRTVDNIPAKSQTNLSSDGSTNQQLEPQFANGIDTYEEY